MKRAKEQKHKSAKDKKATGDGKPSATPAPEAAASTVPGGVGRYVFRYGVLAVVFFVMYLRRQEQQESSVVTADKAYKLRRMNVTCAKDYEEFQGCTPSACGRVIMDNFATPLEIEGLLNIAERGMAHGGAAGGATILDLHSGALSKDKAFINIYKSVKGSVFTSDDFALYKSVKNRVKRAIEFQFKVKPKKLFLTHPTFFSRMDDSPAVTQHDEYWHPHIDRKTYPSFFYTSLLYLKTSEEDFFGGDFVFLDKASNHTIQPRAGRLSFFTSGSENVHRVTPITSGTRFAITISFTCDKEFAIKDPSG